MKLKACLPKAVLIAGPTASGKSAVALELATRLRGAVINADSMQVYRELAVLTARPPDSDLKLAPHRLYGTVPAREAYSVGRWLEDAGRALREAEGEGRAPIFVGGTGLYFRALTEGLAPIPDVSPEIRKVWRQEGDRIGADGLYRELKARDPLMAARLRPGDTQRIVRALEVVDWTGVSLGEWQSGNATPVLSEAALLRIVIAPEREALYAAIDARFDRMLDEGAIDEVRAFMALGLDPGLPAMRAHGVRELGVYLAGTCSLEEAIAKAKTESRRYAKRQMTWARRFMKDWEWFPDGQAVLDAVEAEWPTP